MPTTMRLKRMRDDQQLRDRLLDVLTQACGVVSCQTTEFHAACGRCSNVVDAWMDGGSTRSLSDGECMLLEALERMFEDVPSAG